MNAGPTAPPSFPDQPPAASWGWRKTGLVLALAFAAHLAFVFLLGAKKTVPPRAVANVPVFQLAGPAGELARLTDPTLFALPHAQDFNPGAWAQPPAVTPPALAYDAPAAFLRLDPANLGAAFTAFMRTNRFAGPPPSFKPAPRPAAPAATIESALPRTSSWRLAGDIAGWTVLHGITAPTLAGNDVLAPSRLQLLVDQGGHVLSAVLLDTSGDDAADQQALTLARALEFVPATQPLLGEIIFNWHTVPAPTP